jgi:hypothetical protein
MWLIGKSMPAESEKVLADYLRRQSVVRSVSGVRSEEMGVRQYRCGAPGGGCGRMGVVDADRWASRAMHYSGIGRGCCLPALNPTTNSKHPTQQQ